MARCWTCSSKSMGPSYICTSCESLGELKEVHKSIKSYGLETNSTLQGMIKIQEKGFRDLSNALSSGFNNVVSAIEWGVIDITWALQQQTDVLKSIDLTLKTPTETKANEWRIQAEELRSRGF